MGLTDLRKYHNYIKRTYLNKYVLNDSSLLDLASGKGGDLSKWNDNKFIKSVTGYDINVESVKKARKRLFGMKIKKPIKFFIKDLSSNIINCNKKYDIITSHFAFHYFFKNIRSLKNILSTINNCSKSGTILMITMLDGNKVKDINNSNIQLNILDKNKISNYGKRLCVRIKGTVLDKPEIEYIVKPTFIIKKMKEIGFELIDTKSFDEIDNKSFNLNKYDKSYSYMNRIYIFVKK